MKKLVKIKLINWYTFLDTEIDIKNNSVVTGLNGSGKSTLLDAIQYVLTGGKAKFNQAAGETSKRTVESYIRAKVGLSDREYLRAQDVTSYICLEFFDEEKKRNDLLGVALEYVSALSRVNRLFFKFSNTKVDDCLFKNNEFIKTISEFKRNDVKEKELIDNGNEFRRVIRSFLGIGGNDKYFDLLIKSLYFKPISDMNEFVNNFLLNENNISLDSLKLTIEKLSDLNRTILLEQEKIKELELIVGKITNYNGKLNEKEKLDYFLKLVKKGAIKEALENNRKKLKDNNFEMSKLRKKVSELQIEVDNYIDEISKYDENLKDNDNYKLMCSFEEKLEKIKNEQFAIEAEKNDFVDTFEKEKKLLKDFDCGKKLNVKLDFENISNFYELLRDCNDSVFKELNLLTVKKYEFESEKNDFKSKMDETENKIGLLTSMKRPYKKEVESLISEIKNYFVRNYGKEIEVRPLCEYLEITDDKWRNAIEGYLNTQRFDLIVNPEFFDEALNVYEREKFIKNISGVGLVDVKKFSDVSVNEKTLANFVKSENPYASRYAFYLLNKVVCCEDVNELKQYKNSITPTCMTYKNNVARQINSSVYKYHFIGQKAIEQQLKLYKSDFEEFKKNYSESLQKFQDMNNKIKVLNSSDINKLISLLPMCNKYVSLKKEYESVEKSKNGIVIDNLITNIVSQREQANKKIDELNSEIKENYKAIYSCEEKDKEFKALIEDGEKQISEFEANLLVNEDWDNLFKKEEKNSFLDMENNYQSKISNLSIDIKSLEYEISSEQKNYNDKYNFEEKTGIENVDTYVKELSKKKELDMISYISKSNDLQEQCEKSFKEDFISRLRDNIEEAQAELKRLNKVLKNKNFGKERYEFIWDKSKNKEFANYYRIITSGADFQINTLFSENLSSEDESYMKELFDRIKSSSSLEVANKALEEYMDYRNYMSYDIKVTKEDGSVYFFSRNSKEKSGGEIQTPFYVIIAAAFEQLRTTRESSIGCFVMFDEAFNNMDQKRIEATMNFYNNLSIQLMIAIPPDKYYFIKPYIDTTLFLVSDGDCSDIKSVIEDKKCVVDMK